MSETQFRPILMSTPMVIATMKGNKNQTRRLYDPNCPFRYGKEGDILWVRESCYFHEQENRWFYKATDVLTDSAAHGYKWKPSIHMPKAACRIFLQINSIRVEDLDDISNMDCVNEGIDLIPTSDNIQRQVDQRYRDYLKGDDEDQGIGLSPYLSFVSLWKAIHKSYDRNQLVHRIQFMRIDKPENFI